MDSIASDIDPVEGLAQNLGEKNWHLANRVYIKRSIAELMHEKLLIPREVSSSGGVHRFILDSDNPGIKYTFDAEPRKMDYWFVRMDSIMKVVDGQSTLAIDAPAFYLEFQKQLGVDSFTMAHYIEETYKTLHADSYIYAKGRISADEMADGDYQTFEHRQDGHPWYIFNKGRIGFNVDDYERYAPEADQKLQLSWLAVHKEIATFTGTTGLSFQDVIKQELGADKLAEFNGRLNALGLNSADYYLIPVHDWQWRNKLVYLYAGAIAEKKAVLLGKSEDWYSPQQSIRTFFNVDNPHKHYVKVALSILNTSVYRGVDPKKLKAAPMISAWAVDMLKDDDYLQTCGMELLGEVATVACDHPHFSKISQAPYQYYDYLGVIWRESAVARLRSGESMMTMAALLYVDDEGHTLVGSLIKKSGLTTEQWLTHYFNAYLNPLLHCFYHYGLCFTPHGENTILIMKDYVPQRIVMKDFVEEVHLSEEVHARMPAQIQQVVWKYSDDFFPLFIVSGIFDAIFRYISNVLVSYEGFNEEIFWRLVHQTVDAYQKRFPDQQAQYEKFDIYMPEFVRACINRIRLLTFGYKDDVDFPPIDTHGILENPIAEYRG
ncbi:MAG: IucA/IucC family siderophore biosynthesis protein [Thiotrichaceae bacterium]|nr:IucA/IucC family siderophore biosynthesis protein [Thiotrichaceae bacterium]